MFKTANSRGDFNGFIGAGSHLQGELHFEDMFRVEGKLSGTVVSKGELIIGEEGEVDGEVRVRRIFVAGTVRGHLRAAERIEIAATGRVMADLSTPVLTIEDGAFFEGRCAMEAHPAATKKEERQNIAQMPIAKG